MPKVNWGIARGTISDFDRTKQFKPYDGPLPPAGMYRFLIKHVKSVAGINGRRPQLRVGLELVPRNKEEARYGGYFTIAFLTISEEWPGFYVPFLDAIGVSETEFLNGTITDEEGHVKKIGRWKNDGNQYVKAQVKDGADQQGNPRKEIGYIGEDSGEAEYADDIDKGDDDDFDDDDYDSDESYADDDDDEGGW